MLFFALNVWQKFYGRPENPMIKWQRYLFNVGFRTVVPLQLAACTIRASFFLEFFLCRTYAIYQSTHTV
eukprot:SAG11_NODE_9917_length_870_cov_1.093385_1_plen_69_part_00